MKAFIFMNQHIRDRKTTEPCIVIQPDSPKYRRVYCNRVQINGPSVVMTSSTPIAAISSHEVRAWIECKHEDIEVLA